MDDKYFKNIWELYGLKDNPFTTSPLLVKGGRLPIDCFVGRQEQIKRLGKNISSSGGSRTFVFGEVGVGKTTFVNFVRYKALENGFFTPFKEIAVQENWSSEDFILNTLSAFYATLTITNNNILEKKLLEKLETLLEISSSDKEIGLNIAGLGGSYGKQKKSASRITNFSLQNFFEDIIKNIIRKTGKDIIIHYNNLELLPENKVKIIFNNLRDFFQTDGVHFIFIGNLTTHSIIQGMPRVSSIMSDTSIQIENLTIDEVKEIITKRFDKLKILDLKYFIPYTDGCLRCLYDLMDGNIRYILNSLSTAIAEVTQEKPIKIDGDDIAVILKKILESRYLSKLTTRPREVLLEIVKYKEITNKALSDKLKIKRSNISTYIKELNESGCVYLKRKNGKDKFWSAEHKVRWSLLNVSKEAQENLSRFC